MQPLWKSLVALLRDRSAATAVEYCMILVFIVLAMMLSLTAVANTTNDMWSDLFARVSAVM